MTKLLASIRATVRSARCALFLALASSAGTAQICIESSQDLPIPAPTWASEMVDLDADGDVDLVTAGGNPGTIAIGLNLGDFTFAPQVLVATPGSLTAADVVSGDLDLDGDVDLATASVSSVALFLQQPGGTFAAQLPILVPQSAVSIAIGDFDRDGDLDLATVGQLASGNTVSILLNQGAATFAAPVTYPVGVYCEDLEAGDVDGDLDLDLAVVEYASHTVSILRNLGGGAFAPAVPWPAGIYPYEIDGADLDGDGDLDWAVADAFALGSGAMSHVIVLWNDGTGGYPTTTYIPTSYSPRTVVAVDLDLDGDMDLAVANGNVTLVVHENLGAFAFAPPIVIPLDAYTVGLRAADLDGDGDQDLAAVQDGEGAELWRNCAVSGAPYCFGDGSGTTCPCGNASAPGSQAGCRNSTGLDPTLRAVGSARLAQDQLVLAGAGMPNASVLYFQGTSAIPGGVVFGDGLRCDGGSVVRLAVATNVANSSRYPGPGQLPVSVRGGVSSVGSRVYQAWFRDAAAFCTSATFGLTNGVRVVWRP